MDLLNFLRDHWQVIAGISLLLFTLGTIMQRMKSYLNKEQVESIIEKKFENHCPFSDRVVHLETVQSRNVDNISHIKSKLDQIDFNVQNICDKLDVQYIGKKNGN